MDASEEKLDRCLSVSSRRTLNRPCCFLAMSQFRMAVRALPRCMAPVGEGANRVCQGMGVSRVVDMVSRGWEMHVCSTRNAKPMKKGSSGSLRRCNELVRSLPRSVNGTRDDGHGLDTLFGACE